MSEDLEFRLLDFRTDDLYIARGYPRQFTIQMFGLNSEGESVSIKVTQFEPFFYIKVGDNWDNRALNKFKEKIREHIARDELRRNHQKLMSRAVQYIKPRLLVTDDGEPENVNAYVERCLPTFRPYVFNSIVDWILVDRHKLYGFDNKKLHTFVAIIFKNMNAMRKIKNIWYDRVRDINSQFGFSSKLKKVEFVGYNTELYEAKLPPLLRFFHIRDISPSGWIKLPAGKYKVITEKKTLCNYEFSIPYIIVFHVTR